MPSATRSGPITVNELNNQTPVDESDTNAANSYNTRKKPYRYSHTKAPYIPPPLRPTKRQPPPISVAQKRQRLDTGLLDKYMNTNTAVDCTSNTQPEELEDGNTMAEGRRECVGQQIDKYNTNGPLVLPQTPDNPHDQAPVNSSGLDIRAHEVEPYAMNHSSEATREQLTIIETRSSTAQQAQILLNNPTGAQTLIRQDNMPSTYDSGASAPNFDFATPRRPAQSAGPTVFIIATPPSWARFDTQHDSPLLPFPSTTIRPFNQPSARIEDINPNNPLLNAFPSGNTVDLVSSQTPFINAFDTGSNTEYTPDVFSDIPMGHSGLTSLPNPLDRCIPTMPIAHSRSTSLATRSSTPQLTRLYNTVRRTLPPVPLSTRSLNHQSSSTTLVRSVNPSTNQVGSITIPAAALAATPVAIPTAAPGVTPGLDSCSSSVSHSSGANPFMGSLMRASSLAFDEKSSRQGSTTRDSPAPGSQTQNLAVRSLRQRDFSYDQVVFMNSMKKRWYWYLIADDTFPVNTKIALELCIQYAENHLEVSRKDCEIQRPALDFVRKKESAIRNYFQAGLLSIVKEGYGVNTGTTNKLHELISQSNYIYAEYNIETKKVTGRYWHPCLVRILNAVLFTKRKRGRSIGLLFMPEVIGRNYSEDAMEQPGGTGISVSMIALACTLVLYALQSIKAGDSSQRLGSRKGKPLNFTEKKYASPYRNFVTKLQHYNRLDELRNAYLEDVMKEYLHVHADSNEDSDLDIEVDDGMHSDGD